jgi:hypothetical protein
MSSDPVTGCGCALVLAVAAVYFAGLAAWAFLNETKLIYLLVAGVACWVVITIARRVRLWWRGGKCLFHSR